MRVTPALARSRRKPPALTGLVVLVSLACLACEQKPEPKVEPARATARSSEVHREADELIGTPNEVLRAESSAFNAQLVFEGEDALLLTERTLYRVHPDGQIETRPVSLGIRPVVTDSFIVSWQEGWFHKTGKRGEAKVRWFQEPSEPVWTRGNRNVPVWVVPDPAGGYIVRTRYAQKSIPLYKTDSRIAALALLGGRAFLVELAKSGSWRFVSVGLMPTDSPPAFSSIRAGRPPAQLFPWEDSLIYYSGLSGGVRALSPDLLRDRTIQSDWICSPLSVAQGRVFCASVDGVGVAPLGDGQASWRKANLPGPIAQIAASQQRVGWIIDRGEDRLSLEIAPTWLKRPAGAP